MGEKIIKKKNSRFFMNTVYGYVHFILKRTEKGTEKDVRDDGKWEMAAQELWNRFLARKY